MSLLPDCRKFCLTYGLLSCKAVVAGVSGGADSMCLLDILFALSEESKNDEALRPFPKLIAAHINHGLRGDAADHDEDLVRKYCQDRDIPFYVKRVDIAAMAKESKTSIEQAGRGARYSFFEEIAEKCYPGTDDIFTAVAHHREDQAETILMNLFRGTGPDGLCGMKPVGSNIIRPLLFASKKDILSYVELKNILYAEDQTNLDNTYTRNRWRNQILPLIADVSRKDPVLPLLAFAELAGTDKDYFDEKVFEIYGKNACCGGGGAYGIPCEVIRREHRAIASRLIRYLYTVRFSAGTDLTASHVSAILSLAAKGSGGHRISLAHDRIAYIAEDALFFDESLGPVSEDVHSWELKTGPILLSREETEGEPLLVFDDITPNRVVSISKTYFDVEVILVENPEQVVYNSRTWYCPAEMLSGAVLRTRRQGDWFSRAESTGGKPLRRFLTDRKIPGFVRDRMLIAAHEFQVLWIPGIAHAEGFVDEASKRRFFGLPGHITDKSSVHDTELYRITILDRNEQEEH